MLRDGAGQRGYLFGIQVRGRVGDMGHATLRQRLPEFPQRRWPGIAQQPAQPHIGPPQLPGSLLLRGQPVAEQADRGGVQRPDGTAAVLYPDRPPGAGTVNVGAAQQSAGADDAHPASPVQGGQRAEVGATAQIDRTTGGRRGTQVDVMVGQAGQQSAAVTSHDDRPGRCGQTGSERGDHPSGDQAVDRLTGDLRVPDEPAGPWPVRVSSRT
jgi:hypothetical protein